MSKAIEEREDLGTLLKRARLAIPLTLRAVQDQTNDVSNGYLSQIESGQIKRPSPNVLYQLAELYGLSYSDLLEHAGHRVPSKSEEAREDTLNGIPLRALVDLDDEERAQVRDYVAYLKTRRK